MSNRILKVNAEIQKCIGEVIDKELQNPNINGLITVTKVDTSSDLSVSKVYVSIFGATNKDQVFNEILHSAGFIRKEVSRIVDLRKTPYLEFKLDDSFEVGARIDELIDKANGKSE